MKNQEHLCWVWILDFKYFGNFLPFHHSENNTSEKMLKNILVKNEQPV